MPGAGQRSAQARRAGAAVVSDCIEPFSETYMDWLGVAHDVRRLVNLLRAHGFATRDSGDGTGETPFPHVHCDVEPASAIAEANRMLRILQGAGVRFHPQTEDGDQPEVSLSYNPADGLCIISVLNVLDDALSGVSP